jgi:hypothetical protein
LAGVLVFLLLWTGVLASQASHSDRHLTNGSGGPHTCAVCLFAHGQVLAADVSPIGVWSGADLVLAILPPTAAVPKLDRFHLPQGRAPPSFFS